MAYEMVSTNWSRYSYQVDPNLKGQAGYLNETFYFKNASTIDAKYLTEEFIHEAQDLVYSNGISQYKSEGKINIEFEAKLLAEINYVANGGCCYNAQLFLQGENLMNFMSDLRSWISNGVVNIDQYNAWLSYWGNFSENQYKGTGTIKDRMQPLLLNEFLKQKSDCIKSAF